MKTKGRTKYIKTEGPTNFFLTRVTFPMERPKSPIKKQHVLWSLGKEKDEFSLFESDPAYAENCIPVALIKQVFIID